VALILCAALILLPLQTNPVSLIRLDPALFDALHGRRARQSALSHCRCSTVFRSRPDEVIKGSVLMPAERTGQRICQAMSSMRRGVKRIVKGV
jgi:hypothetical protein